MTFADFAKLGTEQQMDGIWEWGFYIGKSKSEQINHVLYSLNGFFAEVQIDVSDNKVQSVIPYHLLSEDLIHRFSLTESNPFVRATGFHF